MDDQEYMDKLKKVDIKDEKHFGELVKNSLEIAGLTCKELAAQFKTAPGTIVRWINGYSTPPLVSRLEIAIFLTSKAKEAINFRSKHDKPKSTQEHSSR